MILYKRIYVFNILFYLLILSQIKFEIHTSQHFFKQKRVEKYNFSTLFYKLFIIIFLFQQNVFLQKDSMPQELLM